MARVRNLLGAIAAAAALTGLVAPAATADEVHALDKQKCADNVCLILFGSGYKVNKATVQGIGGVQGPAEYQFGYYAETGPTKTHEKICGGSGDGSNCVHQFSIGATYAKGIRVCGWVKRMDNQQIIGNPCITF
ncbi:hypothetical protein GCM10011581_44200 [Saccharopolyspora subtropica]|uniref:Secreted protein n=1 Tax=Saccharopolyspora thermophila TaxID=89367 RepID=A0A917NI15_9PSEU|nr:hypothetical protein [Saccharopolyspora subtropica]GGJ02178.1 hypothetical protein GCM10011581_44200 [Saccharopolyspora subtropica]